MNNRFYEEYFSSDIPTNYRKSAYLVERNFAALLAGGDVKNSTKALNGIMECIHIVKKLNNFGKLSTLRDLYNKCLHMLKLYNKKERRVKWTERQNQILKDQTSMQARKA